MVPYCTVQRPETTSVRSASNLKTRLGQVRVFLYNNAEGVLLVKIELSISKWHLVLD